jgi:phosphoribosylformylglycinamidine synthase
VTAPLSLIITAFAPVGDVRRTLTPAVAHRPGPDSDLVLMDLGKGQEPPGRLGAGPGLPAGGSHAPTSTIPRRSRPSSPPSRTWPATACCWPTTTAPTAACSPPCAKWPLPAMRRHPAAGRPGPRTPSPCCSARSWARCCRCVTATPTTVLEACARHGLGKHSHVIGTLNEEDRIVTCGSQGRRCSPRKSAWTCSVPGPRPAIACRPCATTRMCAAGIRCLAERTTPACAAPGFRSRRGRGRALHPHRARSPAVAILREQGVNGQIEMAAAFHRAGFDAVDVHMSDISPGRVSLNRLQRAWPPAAASPTATCWAPARAGPSPSCSTPAPATSSPPSSPATDTFALGVCNGCQMMSGLQS